MKLNDLVGSFDPMVATCYADFNDEEIASIQKARSGIVDLLATAGLDEQAINHALNGTSEEVNVSFISGAILFKCVNLELQGKLPVGLLGPSFVLE